MQAEVDFWHRPLLLESSQGIVYLLSVLDPMGEGALLRRAVHDRDLENSREVLSVALFGSEIIETFQVRDLEDGGCLGEEEKGGTRDCRPPCQHRTREEMIALLSECLFEGLVRSLSCAHVARGVGLRWNVWQEV